MGNCIITKNKYYTGIDTANVLNTFNSDFTYTPNRDCICIGTYYQSESAGSTEIKLDSVLLFNSAVGWYSSSHISNSMNITFPVKKGQKVTVSGLGTSAFAKTIHNIKFIAVS